MGRSGERPAPPAALRAPRATRWNAQFWDGVECEIEALDAADFALFQAADRLPCVADAGFAAALAGSLSALCRARFSN
jgi:hypothetical protein